MNEARIRAVAEAQAAWEGGTTITDNQLDTLTAYYREAIAVTAVMPLLFGTGINELLRERLRRVEDLIYRRDSGKR